MAKRKKQTETKLPSEDPVAMAVNEGQALIAESESKVEAAMAIYRHLQESPQEVVLQASVEGASLTPKGSTDLLVQLPQEAVAGRSE